MAIILLIEYSDIYLKTFWNLWQYHRDEPALNKAVGIIDFPAANNNNIVSFKFEEKITGQMGATGTRKCCYNGAIEIFKVGLSHLTKFLPN